MTNLTENGSWEPGVYQIELTDPVIGGAEGISNRQAKQLANRTSWLKGQVEALGDGKQPLDATLTALAGQVTSADKLIYANGADSFAQTPLTAFMRTLLDDANQAAALATLGAAAKATTLVGYGITDAQPLDSDLSALAALATTGINVRTGPGTATTRAIAVGAGISVSNGDGVAGNPTLSNTGVLSASGTANQVVVSSSSGNVVFSLPQSIHSGATPSFAQINLGAAPTGPLQAANKKYVDDLIVGSVLPASADSATLGVTQYFVGTEAECVAQNLPALGGLSTTLRFWIIRTEGVSNRTTQRAKEVYGGNTLRNRSFERVRHDLVWYGWDETLTSAFIATQAEVNAGTDDTKVVTPKKLRLGFASLFATNGYLALPSWLGGFVIQWGTLSVADSTGVYTFARTISYPTAHLADIFTDISSGGGGARVFAAAAGGTRDTIAATSDGAPGGPGGFFYLSIGH